MSLPHMTRVLLQPLNLASNKQSTIYPIEPASRKLETLDLTAYESNIYTGTNIPSPNNVSGHQDSPRDMKKTKPIILAPKKHISSIIYMRAMSVCAPCRYARNATKNKETQEPGQGL